MTSSSQKIAGNSSRDLSALANHTFDVVIIGGGISGAWLALHCAQQGYQTALIEKHDYASQTSSSSSKLLHGGIRYLQQMQFDKVRESAMERAEYLFAAPHLSTAVPFIVPTYRDFKRSKLFLNAGMLAYRALCIGENKVIGSREQILPPIHSLSANELNAVCDLHNEDHTGGVVVYERHMLDSERMVLSILQTARKHGAQIHNYVSAKEFLGTNDSVTGVLAQDQLNNNTFSINSRLVINAAGPWIDNLNAQLQAAKQAPSINGFAVGSHIVTRQLCEYAIALATKLQSDAKIDRGGRHVFVIPWRGYSLIGTSYDEIDSPDGDTAIQPEHVQQLLSAVNEAMPSAKLSREDLVSGYSGLYPLKTDNIKSTVYQGSGEYQIIDHSRANKVDGIVTALGAKFTTGRKLSELTMKLVNKKLANANPSPVERVKLLGSEYKSLENYIADKQKQYKDRFSGKAIQHFIMHYGSELDRFIDSLDTAELNERICAQHQDIMGQVAWAITNEQAVTLDDVLFQRTSLGLLGISKPEVEKVAHLMSKQLNWSDEDRDRQLELTLDRIESTKQALNSES